VKLEYQVSFFFISNKRFNRDISITLIKQKKAYYEICKQVQNVVYDTNLGVPHGTLSGQTVFYDNKQSVAQKVL
jgi:hypothetical protein